MKTLLITLVLLSNSVSLADNLIFSQILKNNPKVDKKLANNIAGYIKKYSNKYNIPPKIYAAILMQESAYNVAATNKSCQKRYVASDETTSCLVVDYGMSQINVKTIESYNFDKTKLTSDIEYSIKSGAKVLSWFYKTYHKKEPNTWWCRYNTGTAHFQKIEKACLKYKKLVKRFI